LDQLLPGAHLYIREEAVTANGKNGGLPASLLIPDTPEILSDYITLYSPEIKDPVPMTANSILITDKLSRVMGVGIGDNFIMTLTDGGAYTAVVTASWIIIYNTSSICLHLRIRNCSGMS